MGRRGGIVSDIFELTRLSNAEFEIELKRDKIILKKTSSATVETRRDRKRVRGQMVSKRSLKHLDNF